MLVVAIGLNELGLVVMEGFLFKGNPGLLYLPGGGCGNRSPGRRRQSPSCRRRTCASGGG